MIVFPSQASKLAPLHGPSSITTINAYFSFQVSLMSDLEAPSTSFDELGLASDVLAAVNEVGYEIPSPIQAQTIPHLIDGMDLLGHAPRAISQITCPIGDPNLGKQPISIAIGVTQALLSHNMNANRRHRSALS